MKKIIVGIDVSPLYTEHKVRGVGFYTKWLLKALKELGGDLEVRELKNNEEVEKQNYDLLHLPYFSPFFKTLPKELNKPWVVTVHDLIPIRFKKHYPPGIKGSFSWQLQKRNLLKAKAIITDSKASKEDIIKYTSYPEKRIEVVYLAPDKGFRKLKKGNWEQKLKDKYKLPEEFVLYVGDVNWNKNILGLVEACKKVQKSLVVVGKQAANRDYDKTHIENQDLVSLQKQVEINPLITLMGFVSKEELVQFYNLAKVYCQPSFGEGFGFPVLEAMSCGCPVVSSSWGSLPEIAGEAALLVEPEADSLGVGIKRAWESKGLSSKLVKAGNMQVKKFSWEKTAKETLRIYQQALRL